MIMLKQEKTLHEEQKQRHNTFLVQNRKILEIFPVKSNKLLHTSSLEKWQIC